MHRKLDCRYAATTRGGTVAAAIRSEWRALRRVQPSRRPASASHLRLRVPLLHRGVVLLQHPRVAALRHFVANGALVEGLAHQRRRRVRQALERGQGRGGLFVRVDLLQQHLPAAAEGGKGTARWKMSAAD